MKKAIGYIRVSTLKQKEEGVSPEAQLDKIQTWCKVHGYELVSIENDAGLSGKSMKKRDGLKRALENIEKGNALVAYSFSRLARSTKDLLWIAAQLREKGADLVSITENIDTTGAVGTLIFTVLAALAQFERDLTSERTKTSLDYKRKVGEQFSRVPYGYNRVEPASDKEPARLVPNPEEMAVLETIRQMKANGMSLGKIASDLNERQIPPKRGGEKWYPSSIQSMLKTHFSEKSA